MFGLYAKLVTEFPDRLIVAAIPVAAGSVVAMPGEEPRHASEYV
jgi:hypothetical protein